MATPNQLELETNWRLFKGQENKAHGNGVEAKGGNSFGWGKKIDERSK